MPCCTRIRSPSKPSGPMCPPPWPRWSAEPWRGIPDADPRRQTSVQIGSIAPTRLSQNPMNAAHCTASGRVGNQLAVLRPPANGWTRAIWPVVGSPNQPTRGHCWRNGLA